MQIRLATFEEIVDLRHDVLRHDLPRGMAIFPGDDASTTLHFGAFLSEPTAANIGCATMHASTWEGAASYQLRGMATRADWRSRGLGRELLTFVERTVRETSPSVERVWCNARVPAVRFYESMGWRVVSDEFEIPTAGPHRRMLKTVSLK